jgi:hypothetical protein
MDSSSVTFRMTEARSRNRRMKTSRDATTFVLEHAAVISAKIAVIVNRHAVRIVSAVIVKHTAAVPICPPRAVTPTVVSKEPNRNSHGEADSESKHQAARGR